MVEILVEAVFPRYEPPGLKKRVVPPGADEFVLQADVILYQNFKNALKFLNIIYL